MDTYELAGRVNVYISPVHNLNTNCNAQNCMTNSEFSKVQIDFYKKYKHRRYFDLHIPQCNFELCSAVTSFSHTVDPNGNLYKCWNDIGDNDEVIGSIVSDFKSTTTHTKWLTYSPFESENCKKCKLLPICLGGCPDFYIKKEIHNCHHLKNNIEDFIQVFRMYKEEKLNKQY